MTRVQSIIFEECFSKFYKDINKQQSIRVYVQITILSVVVMFRFSAANVLERIVKVVFNDAYFSLNLCKESMYENT